MFQRHRDDLADPVLIDVMHCEALDVVVAENPFLSGVDVAKANVDADGGREIDDMQSGQA